MILDTGVILSTVKNHQNIVPLGKCHVTRISYLFYLFLTVSLILSTVYDFCLINHKIITIQNLKLNFQVRVFSYKVSIPGKADSGAI